MVQFYQPKDTWSEVGQLFGQGATQGYTNRADELALQKSIESLPPNATPQEVLKKLVGTKTYSPEAKQMATKNYFAAREVEQAENETKIKRKQEQRLLEEKKSKEEQVQQEKKAKETKQEEDRKAKQEKESRTQKEAEEKRNREIASNEALLEKSYPDMPIEERKEKAKTYTPDAVKALIKPEKQAPKSEFQKGVEKKAADSFFKAQEDNLKLKDSVANIDRVVELAEKLRGPVGMLKALSGFSSEAAELNSTALPAIDTILKVFNPVGAIPTQKINLVRSEFGIKATDTHASIIGKAESLKRYLNQAVARNNDKIAMYELYDGKIPKDIEKKFDEETESLVDVMIDEGKKLNGTNYKPGQKVRVRNKLTGVTGWNQYQDHPKFREKYDIIE